MISLSNNKHENICQVYFWCYGLYLKLLCRITSCQISSCFHKDNFGIPRFYASVCYRQMTCSQPSSPWYHTRGTLRPHSLHPASRGKRPISACCSGSDQVTIFGIGGPSLSQLLFGIFCLLKANPSKDIAEDELGVLDSVVVVVLLSTAVDTNLPKHR